MEYRLFMVMLVGNNVRMMCELLSLLRQSSIQ